MMKKQNPRMFVLFVRERGMFDVGGQKILQLLGFSDRTNFLWKVVQEMENVWFIVPLQSSMIYPITVEMENVPGAKELEGILESANSVEGQVTVDFAMELEDVNFAMEEE